MEDVTLTPVAATLQQDPSLAPVIKVKGNGLICEGMSAADRGLCVELGIA